MPLYNNEKEPGSWAFFSDTTQDYVSPRVPELFKNISIRLRVRKGMAGSCFLVLEPWSSDQQSPPWRTNRGKGRGKAREKIHRKGGLGKRRYLRMRQVCSDECFDYYEARFELTFFPLRYFFEIIAGAQRIRYTRRGVKNTIRQADLWHIIPGFETPVWAEGAVMYQIFVDRFCNGDPTNDVVTGEYSYMGKPVIRVEDWDRPPSNEGYREFYGGDLQGVIDKLDYLQDLGVEAIYLNPIFLSPSSHKYDTQDYEHIDPHFGRIVKARKEKKKRGPRTNRNAPLYLSRVTDPANLEAGDRLFARLVREAHARGIRIILDGVFNHCGSFHRWLDGERIYEQIPGEKKGARAAASSPYVTYFNFSKEDWPRNDSYEAWWDFGTLPKLNYDNSPELCEKILQVASKWVSPPFNADGWRLDVAADLGHSREFNHRFWKRFREAVKKANPEAVILAENYMDSQNWLQGDEWDTIMNYEFFMEPVTGFFTGMEKHSDARREELHGDPDAFWRSMLYTDRNALPDAAIRISMNELSNHDHSRFLTRTNRLVGRAEQLGTDAASEGVSMELMRQAVLLQMTWTGAPTIYYGDEAGLAGFTDPDNRRTYPWGHEDKNLIRYHKALTTLRRDSRTLRRGSLIRLPDADGILAYARFSGMPGKIQPEDGREAYIILININHIRIDYEADVTCAGISPHGELACLLCTDEKGFAAEIPEKDDLRRRKKDTASEKNDLRRRKKDTASEKNDLRCGKKDTALEKSADCRADQDAAEVKAEASPENAAAAASAAAAGDSAVQDAAEVKAEASPENAAESLTAGDPAGRDAAEVKTAASPENAAESLTAGDPAGRDAAEVKTTASPENAKEGKTMAAGDRQVPRREADPSLPGVHVRGGRIHLQLPPQSGFLLRYVSAGARVQQ